jgi:peptide/nickel transport system ATP-binding protein
MPLLEIDNLAVAIAGEAILKGVSLSIEAGETLGLVGESGSGKSMTALAAMGLLPDGAQASGRILFEGREITEADESALCAMRGSRAAMVFQEPMTALNPVQRIGAQVAEIFRIHTKADRRAALAQARALLDRVGLSDAGVGLERYPHQISGGQRQRVLIAMAIALKPRLLIADEPATALDATTQAEIIRLLRELVREERMALLFISHDLAAVAQISDRIAFMDEGAIVETTPAHGLSALAHPISRALFAATGYRGKPRPLPPRAEPVLEAAELSKAYRNRGAAIKAAERVSLSIAKGETVGLVGESGSGKSTVARLVLALDRPDSGELRLCGAAFSGERVLRRRIQAVFQDPFGSFNPRHRVGRILAEPLQLDPSSRGETLRRVAHMLAAVGLEPRDANRYPHEFSGGERQRIAIARALMIKPSLVVLDEAVSALDATIRASVLDLLQRMQETLGVSYLFISHDLGVVRAIADRIAVMRQGRIIEEADTETLFSRPQTAYTQKLIAATPVLDAAAAST